MSERPTSGPQIDLTNEELRAEMDRVLKRLLNKDEKWLPSEKQDVELYMTELIHEVLDRIP
jgi:hypothetical protein